MTCSCWHGSTPKPVDLAEITTTGLLTMRRHDVDVTTDISGPPAMIDGDRDQLHRLVRNLIHNAEEHAATRIEIAVQTGVDVVRLIVADDGPGIPVEFRDSAFERFVRLDTARTRDSGGTGLGLAIVRDVATAHHGTISLPRQA
jgi:signal transduction histidine kinase